MPAAERHEESNRGDLCCLSSSCLSSSLPYKGTKPGTGIVQIHQGAEGLMKCCCCQSSAIRKHSSFASMCISQQCCIAGTSDTYAFLLSKVIAVLLHPQSRLHQQVPSRTDLRGWLLMACGIMHVTAGSYHHTMQGGAVVNLYNGCAKVCWCMFTHGISTEVRGQLRGSGLLINEFMQGCASSRMHVSRCTAAVMNG